MDRNRLLAALAIRSTRAEQPAQHGFRRQDAAADVRRAHMHVVWMKLEQLSVACTKLLSEAQALIGTDAAERSAHAPAGELYLLLPRTHQPARCSAPIQRHLTAVAHTDHLLDLLSATVIPSVILHSGEVGMHGRSGPVPEEDGDVLQPPTA
eukprot:672299-Prymnesium_polylepis.1